jgi:prepilin-type N-terminal cleavage/methylation domain-containing protein
MKRRAFTLVELLLVVVILAILAAVAIPKAMSASLRGREAALRGDLRLLRDSISRFMNDTGVFPATLYDMTLDASAAPTWGKDSTNHVATIFAGTYKGPYLDYIPTSPIDGAAFNYNSFLPPTIGRVYANDGTALDGTNYGGW